MDTAKKIAASIAFLKKHGLKKFGYRITKIPKPKGTPEIHLMLNSAFLIVANQMMINKVPKLTVRKIMMKLIKNNLFNACLDAHYKGTARTAFDNIDPKKWTLKTVIQDIRTQGQFKRFKLLERAIKWDMELIKTLLDPNYRPTGDKVVRRKRKYKKANSRK